MIWFIIDIYNNVLQTVLVEQEDRKKHQLCKVKFNSCKTVSLHNQFWLQKFNLTFHSQVSAPADLCAWWGANIYTNSPAIRLLIVTEYFYSALLPDTLIFHLRLDSVASVLITGMLCCAGAYESCVQSIYIDFY